MSYREWQMREVKVYLCSSEKDKENIIAIIDAILELIYHNVE